jgi:hypothetical protein
VKDFTIKPRPDLGRTREDWAHLNNAELAASEDKHKGEVAESADFRPPTHQLIRDNETSAQRKAEARLDQTQARIDIRDQIYHAKLQNKKLLMIQEANEKAFLAFQSREESRQENEASRQQAAESQVFREAGPKRRKGWKDLVRRWANACSSLFVTRPRPKK